MASLVSVLLKKVASTNGEEEAGCGRYRELDGYAPSKDSWVCFFTSLSHTVENFKPVSPCGDVFIY